MVTDVAGKYPGRTRGPMCGAGIAAHDDSAVAEGLQRPGPVAPAEQAELRGSLAQITPKGASDVALREEFRGGEGIQTLDVVKIDPTCDENVAVRQQGSCVLKALGAHVSGVRKGLAARIEQF